ncbi:DUF4105 domain-containing protein [Candidatus Binatia bacterium]|nr:DUF4105 domain-containing protein [Candidatus Binatia bacterium]
MKRVVAALAALPIVLLALWCGTALGFRFPGPTVVRHGVGGLFVLGVLVTLLTVRPLARKIATLAVPFVLFAAFYATVRPSNDRDWSPEVAHPPTGEVRGDTLTLKNVRDFRYRSESDFTERWETRTYDLSAIEGADLFLSYWGSPLIAHTIVAWDFASSPPLAISIETRKEKGEQYSAIRGFFREYELYYVAADERDLIGLRTNHRNEDVYLYRVRMSPAAARDLLLDYVKTMNDLAEHPRWYNAAIDNCTTGIRVHVQHIGSVNPWDWRILVNGYGDQLLYERGNIATDLPFDVLKRRSNVVAPAQAAGDAPDFSARIREGLPPRPEP